MSDINVIAIIQPFPIVSRYGCAVWVSLCVYERKG